MDLDAVAASTQEHLRTAAVDGWLLYYYRGMNPIFWVKMGGRLVRHSRRLIFQLSEVSVPRRLFQGVLDRIGRLSPAPS